MKLEKLVKNRFTTAALACSIVLISGTTYGAALAFSLGGNTTQTTEQPVSSPQVDAATQRVESAKANLDLAHRRLDAAKALLKAAEAEFRAAKTDRDAMVLTTQAQQLADASGIPKNSETAAPVPAQANTAAPAAVAPAPTATNAVSTPVYTNSENTIDFSGQGAPPPSVQ